MAARKLGYIPDTKDPRDLDFQGWSLAASNLPKKFSIRQQQLRVLDQETTSECVGFGTAQALLTAERYAGVVLDLPSPPFIYYTARRIESPNSFVVFDNGTMVRSAMDGLFKVGAPSEKLWPFSTNPFLVNRRPSIAASMGAYARRGGEYRRIFEVGEQRALAVKAAIFAGTPVVFGTQVGYSFMESEGPAIIGPPRGALAGGHCMMLDGWEDVDGGEDTVFDAVNSWGISWGNLGCWWMTKEYLLWMLTQDLWCVRGWHAMQEMAR